MSIERDATRDRPPGLAPRGSSAGFGIVMLYWLAYPGLVCMALIPFGRTVFDFLFPAMACPVLALAVLLPMTFGFKSRRYWGVWLFRWRGAAEDRDAAVPLGADLSRSRIRRRAPHATASPNGWLFSRLAVAACGCGRCASHHHQPPTSGFATTWLRAVD